jgi:hypothetical protein
MAIVIDTSQVTFSEPASAIRRVALVLPALD